MRGNVLEIRRKDSDFTALCVYCAIPYYLYALKKTIIHACIIA